MGDSTIRLRWALDVVDKGAGKEMLRTDRALRRAVEATDKAMSARARKAQASERTLTRAATAERRATERAAKATQAASRAQTQMARSSGSVAGRVRVGTRAVNEQARAYDHAGRAAMRSASQQVSAARRSGHAVQQASVAQRARGAGGVAAGAAGGLAGRAAGLAGAAGLGFGLAVAGGQAVGFEKQMANVQARLLTTGATMRKLSDFALHLGATTQFSGREAAGAMDELAAQGFSVREIFKTLPGTLSLAAASGTDLASAAEIQTAALRGFGLEASQAGHVADVLAQTTNKSAVNMADLGEMLPYVSSTARQTGTSFEQVAAAAGILGNAGIKGSMAGTALRTSMLRLTDPSKKMQDRLRGIGLDAKDLAAVPLPRVIGLIADKLKGLPRGEQVGIVSAVFGKEAAPSMLNLMAKGQKGIDKMTDSLTNSRGAAKRAADIMRNNVAGAWDNFTGSIETASIKLSRRFMPALKDALNVGAKGVNKLPGLLGDLGAGLRGDATGKATGQITTTKRGPGGNMMEVTEGRFADPTLAQKVGGKLRDVAQTIGPAALDAGKQLLDAFKPALPYLQNVLLPVLVGIGKGLLISIGGAIKVILPIIKLWAGALGFVGKLMRPFRGALDLVGQGIALVFGGAILKGIALVGKLGGVFRLVGAAARLLAVPVTLVNRAFQGLFRGIGRLPSLLGGLGGVLTRAGGYFTKFPGKIAGVAGRVLASTGRLVSAAGRGLARLPSRLGSLAASGGRAVVSRLGSFVRRAGTTAGRIAGGIVSGLSRLPGRLGSLGSRAVSRFVGAWSGVASKILGAIGKGGKGVAGLAKSLANGVIKLVESAINSVDKIGPISVPDVNLPRFRRGGLVDAMVSPGEMMIEPGGRSWPVPGTRTAADNVHVRVPQNTAVVTGHGRGMLAAGWPLNDVIANQAPHFATGGRVVGASMYGGPGDRTTRKPERGASGALLEKAGNRLSFAELEMGKALGGLKMGAKLRVAYKGKSAIGRKLDIGRGGGQVGGRKRAIDLYYHLANKIGFRGLGLVRIGGAGGAGGSTVALTDKLSFAGGLPSAGGALGAGFEAGQAGTPLGSSISDIVTGATAQLEKRTASVGSISGGARARGGAGSRAIRRAIVAANTIDRRRFPYSTPGDRSAKLVAGAMDCSGAVSKVALFAGLMRGGVQASPYFKTWGAAGPGKHFTTYSKGGGGASGHVFATINGRGFGTSGQNPGGGAGWFTPTASYKRQFIARHPKGYRTGGMISTNAAGGLAGRIPAKWRTPSVLLEIEQGGVMPGLRSGGILANIAGYRAGGAVSRSVDQLVKLPVRAPSSRVGDVLKGLADLIEQIDDVAAQILRQRLADIRARARRLLRGGLTRKERPAYRRLVAESRDVRGDLRQQDRPASFARLTQIETSLAKRISRVRRGGVHGISERVLERRLVAAQRTVQTEMGRRFGLVIRAVDKQAEVLERGRTRLGQMLRIGNVDESSSRGLKALADFSNAHRGVLEKQRRSLERALVRARRSRNRESVEEITSKLDEVRDNIAESFTTWIEQIRQQAAAAAQERVDVSTHGSSMASLGQQRLELEQRIAGAFDTGGQARADYIRNVITPALNAELADLRNQQAVAVSQGDVVLARQIAEAIAGKSNDILQGQLDALEQIQENTDQDPLRGSLAFESGVGRVTDLVGFGTGV